MTNRTIRKQQSENAHNLVQRRFPKPTNPVSIKYDQDREKDRRKNQIARGYLTTSNGLEA